MALVGLSVWFELVHQTAKLTRIVAEAGPASGMSLAVAASTASKLLADGCHCRRGLDPQQTRGSVPAVAHPDQRGQSPCRALAVWLAATLLTTRGAWCV